MLQFLEFSYDCIQKLNKTVEDDKMGEIIGTEIIKWVEMLVARIDMFADNAVLYLKELRSHARIDKAYNKIITSSVSKY